MRSSGSRFEVSNVAELSARLLPRGSPGQRTETDDRPEKRLKAAFTD